MPTISRETVSSNFVWRLLERFGAQVVSFIVSIVLARLLDPEVYGDVALVLVFSSILEVFVDSGLGNALIQKKEVDDIDYSSVFYFNIVFCILLYGIMFVCAPFISDFYGNDLTLVIRVLSLVIVISGVKNVQQAYVSKNMMFRKFFYATLAGTIGSAFVGIFLAYRGYGVWALVAQNLFNKIIDTVVLWITVGWRPIPAFSTKRLSVLFSFGWKLLVAQLFDTVYENCRSLIIGKKYSADSLAFYNKGKQFPMLIITNVGTSVDSVLLPTMSKEQDDRRMVAAMLSRSVKLSSFVIFPLLTGLAGVGTTLISIILNEKWLPCTPYMQVFCFAMMLTPISLSNLNAIKAIGNSGVYLKLEIVRKIIGIITLVAFMWYGPMFIAFSYLLNQILGFYVNTLGAKKLLDYGPAKQLKDIIPSITCAAIMLIGVNMTGRVNVDVRFILLLQILVGIIVYSIASYLINKDNYMYAYKLAKSFLQKRG